MPSKKTHRARRCVFLAKEHYNDAKQEFISFYKQQARDFRRFLRKNTQAENPYSQQYRNNDSLRFRTPVDYRDMLRYHQEISRFVRLAMSIQD